MDLRHFTHLVVLADEGSFGRAAERVHLSQPAFSRSVQGIEAELGMTLFERDRGSRAIRCTAAGEFVVRRARAVLQATGNLGREVAMFREGMVGELRFAMGPYMGAAVLPALLVEASRKCPQLRLRVMVQSPVHLIPLLRRQELDFLVADERFALGDDTLRVELVGVLDSFFYVRAGHPLLARKDVRLADLRPYGLATGQLPASVRREALLEMGLPEDGELPVAVECEDAMAQRAVTLATDAIMASTPALVDAELRAGTLVRLQVQGLPPSLRHARTAIITVPGQSLSPAALFAMDVVRRFVADRQPVTDGSNLAAAPASAGRASRA